MVLPSNVKIAPREAEALKNRYFDTFGKVHDYLESLVANAREKGYTETIFGRRRYFPALHSTNRVAREAAERAALNAPIQGSAADIMKIAMIRAEQTLAEAHVKSRIILQIHDELVVEIAPGEGDQVTELVRNAKWNTPVDRCRAAGRIVRHRFRLATRCTLTISSSPRVRGLSR